MVLDMLHRCKIGVRLIYKLQVLYWAPGSVKTREVDLRTGNLGGLRKDSHEERSGIAVLDKKSLIYRLLLENIYRIVTANAAQSKERRTGIEVLVLVDM